MSDTDIKPSLFKLPSLKIQHTRNVALIGNKSPGVVRIQAISSAITPGDRAWIFRGVFLIAYAYGLDGTLRYAYQPEATNSYSTHSTLVTVNVIRAVIAAAAQPTAAAKIADVFGRVELIFVSIFFYVLGTIIEATTSNVQGFAAGAVFYQIGYTCIILLVEVIVADTTSLRSHVFFSYVPAAPFLVNTWVSGNVSSAVLKASSWRCGIGMWAIIYPICSLPLILSLLWVSRKAKRSGALNSYSTSYELYGAKYLSTALFWQLDVIGILLLICVFGFILVPLTVAKGDKAVWGTAKIIAPLVIRIHCVPVWILWEQRAPHPMLPFHLMTDQAVWGALGIAVTLNFAWTMQADFPYTILPVSFNFTTKSALRITSLYSFFSVITGILLGLVIYKFRRLKPFILFGTALYMVAFGLLIRYRGGVYGSHGGVVGAQVLLGVAGGFFPYPAQASIQAATEREHVAVITALYLASYSIGAALGNAISGAIWSQIIHSQLSYRFHNSSEAELWFASPLTQIQHFPPGTFQRNAAIDAYAYVQRVLCTVGIALCAVLVGFACVLRDLRLGDGQSLIKETEGGVWVGVGGLEMGNMGGKGEYGGEEDERGEGGGEGFWAIQSIRGWRWCVYMLDRALGTVLSCVS